LRLSFNRPNNLEDLRQRIRAEVEQISPDIIERSVQSVDECEMVGGRAISKFALNFIVNIRCLFIFV
jgi:predicted house-cleaning NTP pyrophosphatase (Maf/HAM1 superfamily)